MEALFFAGDDYIVPTCRTDRSVSTLVEQWLTQIRKPRGMQTLWQDFVDDRASQWVALLKTSPTTSTDQVLNPFRSCIGRLSADLRARRKEQERTNDSASCCVDGSV